MIFNYLDLKTKKWLLLFLSCLLCWWLLVASATCSASAPEQVYTITETELETLESSLTRLRSINSKLQMESAQQLEQVKLLQAQVQLLQSQLATLQMQSQNQESLLTAANKSLAEYATEARRTRLRIKAQRNGWLVASILAVTAAIIR